MRVARRISRVLPLAEPGNPAKGSWDTAIGPPCKVRAIAILRRLTGSALAESSESKSSGGFYVRVIRFAAAIAARTPSFSLTRRRATLGSRLESSPRSPDDTAGGHPPRPLRNPVASGTRWSPVRFRPPRPTCYMTWLSAWHGPCRHAHSRCTRSRRNVGDWATLEVFYHPHISGDTIHRDRQITAIGRSRAIQRTSSCCHMTSALP